MSRPKKIKTPEEIEKDRLVYNARKKRWRDEHPEEWKEIQDNSKLRCAARIQAEREATFQEDLGKIKAELAIAFYPEE